MRTETIKFPDQETLSVFPIEKSYLAQAITELGLSGGHPVIVLVGGEIEEKHRDLTRQAMQTIAKTAEDMIAVIIGGSTDRGVMAEIGQIRSQNGYKFPLVGVTPEELVTWPGGPLHTNFLWLGKQRWQLESHYSHFILVPGSEFGDESSWIEDAAVLLSKGHQSVTVLISGGEISRKEIEVSLENGRPVVALSNTGGLADELARQPERNSLITLLPGGAEKTIAEDLQAALSINERGENSLVSRS
ncbi:MAG TPA: hypothetical protein VK897_09950 [Anaerolineales bacterium]|nr:hypothetical protein [Anaerolineales bacterium]